MPDDRRRRRSRPSTFSLYRGSFRCVVGITALTFVLILGLGLVGAASRSADGLAAIWPANAVLLALLMRRPQCRSVAGAVGAVSGYLAADLVAGRPFGHAIWFVLANVSGVLVGLAVSARLSAADRQLRRPSAVAAYLVVCVAASLGTIPVGTVAMVQLFDHTPVHAATLWFGSELASYLSLLPPLLMIDSPARRWRPSVAAARDAISERRVALATVGPGVLLVVGLVVGMQIGGPAGVVCTLPGLLWAALTGRVVATTVLVLVANVWNLFGISFRNSSATLVPGDFEVPSQVAMQIALALVTTGALVVVARIRQQDDQITALEELAGRDPLTGTLNRRAFETKARAQIEAAALNRQSVTMLMVDLDHFKIVNDTYGHHVGDQVLSHVSTLLAGRLRESDLFSRVGGEEFAIVVSGMDRRVAADFADHLRRLVRDNPVQVMVGPAVHLTASIGVAHADCRESVPEVTDLMERSDAAMYRAKRNGRDRVVVEAEPSPVRSVVVDWSHAAPPA